MGAIKDAFKEMDKKTLWWLLGGIGGLVLLIVILSLLSRMSITRYETYEKVETRLVEAAKKYFIDNNALLPSKVNDSSNVTLNTLVVGEYIKPLNKYLKNGEVCDANVIVTKLANDYDYIPYLNCGTDYTSVELYKKISEDNLLITSGFGLYSIENEKVFKGEVKNNYVSLNGNLWRIVRIDENNNIVLVSNFRTDLYAWDDRYNQESDSNDGINNYNLSRIKDSIEKEYNSGNLLKSSEKSKIVYSKACIGERKNTDTGNYLNIECKELTDEEVPIRLLTIGEYIEASADLNCKTVQDRGCTNYNYLHDLHTSFWTITKGQKNSSYIYSVSENGILESRASIERQVRYVITLSSKAFYSKGSGTYDDPYFIK